MSGLRQDVEACGWAVTVTHTLAEFEQLARFFGSPRGSREGAPAFEQLRVVSQADARPHSHSARYGAADFPFHTDAAHWQVPARFMVLRADAASSRPTFVLDLRRDLTSAALHVLGESLFTIVNGRRSFLAPAWDPARAFLRYDPTCMRPATRAGVRAGDVIDDLVRETTSTRIEWAAGTTLIVDNWRCLHARGLAVREDDPPRRLTRALLEAGD